MRLFAFLVAMVVAGIVQAQDPTVPSPQILERLGGEPQQVLLPPTPGAPNLPTVAKTPEPLVSLKAIVLADSDHGSAIIAIDGRRVRVKLVRAADDLGEPVKPAREPLNGVVIQGKTYFVENFSAQSILLRSGNDTLLVQ